MMIWWREDYLVKDLAKDGVKGGGELRSLNSSVSKNNRHYMFSLTSD